jgi:hypothetical protein
VNSSRRAAAPLAVGWRVLVERSPHVAKMVGEVVLVGVRAAVVLRTPVFGLDEVYSTVSNIRMLAK